MTSAQNTAVEFQQMQQMSVAFASTANMLDGLNKQVGEIRQHAMNAYQGDAQRPFQHAAETWQANFAVVIKSCQNMSEELAVANENYTSNDSAIQEAANKMSSGLQSVLDGST